MSPPSVTTPPADRRAFFDASTRGTALTTCALGAHVVLVLAMHAVPGFDWEIRHRVHLSTQLVTLLLLAWSGWRTTRDPDVAEGTREAWRWLAMATLAQWAGYSSYWILEQVLGVSPNFSVSDLLYLPYYPFLLRGLLRYPQATRRRERGVTHWLDAATVVAAGSVIFLHLAVPRGVFDSSTALGDILYLVLYPLGDAVILASAATLWMHEPPGQRRRPVTYLALALLVALVADAAYAYRLGRGVHQMGSLLDVWWALSAFFFGLAAHRERVDAARSACVGDTVAMRVDAPDRAPMGVSARPVVLPYLTSAVLLALFLAEVVADGRPSMRLLAVGATVVTGLVLARQWVAVRENLRLSATAAARESEARFGAMVQHASEMLLVVDADFSVRYASPAATMALGGATPPLGGATAPLVGESLLQLVDPHDVTVAVRLLGSAVTQGRQSVRGEWRFRARDGRSILAEHVATSLLDEPTVCGIVLNSRDISDRAELERQLMHQAYHDPLTGLANRTLFLDRLDHAFRRNARGPTGIALLFLDLDDFKRVNDSLGHAAGDELLVHSSARIAAQLRTGDTLARLGGDEFAILVEDLEDFGDATDIADRVLTALRTPFTLEGKEIHVGVSVGIAGSRDASSPSDLMRNADLAMYIAKTRGKRARAVFEPHMHTEVVARLDIEADLRRAIDAEELSLVYQPVVGLEHRNLMGVEALVRWTHPTRGAISPATFIPIAEESGLVVPLGRWVLREACAQARRWRDETGQRIHMGVNISARHIHHASLLEDVREALDAAGLPPGQLLLEITESVLMRDVDEVAHVLHALKAYGVALALDDFGTGYSSLSYLQRFPIDVLKIDRSFVAPMASASYDSRLVRAIIAMGQSLGMRIVAEGVEAEAQLQALRVLGCTMAQGYLFAAPQSSDEILAHIREEVTLAPSELTGRALESMIAAAR